MTKLYILCFKNQIVNSMIFNDRISLTSTYIDSLHCVVIKFYNKQIIRDKFCVRLVKVQKE